MVKTTQKSQIFIILISLTVVYSTVTYIKIKKVTEVELSQERKKFLIKDKLPQHFEWRRDLLMKPRSQIGCSACWSFTVTDILADSLSVMSGGAWTYGALSSQYLLSCSTVHFGCSIGASPEDTYNLPQVTQLGIPLEIDMPYEKEVTACKMLPKDAIRVKTVPYTNIDICTNPSFIPFLFKQNIIYKNITNMKKAIIEYGPISGTLAITESLYNYKSGIFKARMFERVLGGHAIEIIGWHDVPGDESYWIIKNWYGMSWGESSYGRIALGRNESDIESRASVCRVNIPDFLKTEIENTDISQSAVFY